MIVNNLKNRISVLYSLLQALYWAGCVFVIVFCAAFLKNRGFDNSRIGMIIALSNGAGFVLTNAFSGSIDKGKLSAGQISGYLLVFQIVFTVILITAESEILTCIGYTGMFALCLAVGPLYTKISVDCNHFGQNVDFGFSRGIGSLSYALTSLAAGIMVRYFTVFCLPYFVIASSVCQVLILHCLHPDIPKPKKNNETQCGILHLDIKDAGWIVFVVGIALLFSAENTFNSFRPNIVYNVGGTDSQIGYLSSVKAFCEIPVMLLFSYFLRKIKVKKLLVFSLIFSAVKMALISAAADMTMLYVAFMFNAVSYGLYTPSVVEYINQSVSYEDSAKIQLLCGSATTLGTVAATLSFGAIFDIWQFKKALMILTALGTAGSTVAILSILKMDIKRRKENKDV